MPPTSPFTVVRATGWELAGTEIVGVTEHPWLRSPEGGELYLWKPARAQRLQRREHWAEKVASELARTLGVPCVVVELAEREGVPGCLVRDFQGHGHQMHSGADLLSAIDPTFRPEDRHEAYTIDNVRRVLAGVDSPGGDPGPAVPESFDAFDTFAGYLLFDALVLNRDRHAANWSIMRSKDGVGGDSLCPLYDNASSLAMSMTDTVRVKRLASKGVAAYVRREDHARAFALLDGESPSLLDVAQLALARCSASARDHWLGAITRVKRSELTDILDRIPEMSEPLRTFTTELIESNRRRIADVFG